MNNPKYNAFLKVAEMGQHQTCRRSSGLYPDGYELSDQHIRGRTGHQALRQKLWRYRPHRRRQGIASFYQRHLQHGKSAVQQGQRTENLDSGRLTIGAPASVHINWLPGMIKMYSALHPGIDIEIKCCDDANLLEEMIYDGDIDCGFIIMPPKKKKSKL